MNAKEKQLEFIKTYLKPTLKNLDYKTIGQTWWKDKGEFYSLINLQNFSWNTKDSVNFCFNISIVLKANISKDKKPSYNDSIVMLRENGYLTELRKRHSFRNHSGYILSTSDNLNHFIEEFKIDFENFILPQLEKLNSLQDCIDNFGNMTFFGERLINAIKTIKTTGAI